MTTNKRLATVGTENKEQMLSTKLEARNKFKLPKFEIQNKRGIAAVLVCAIVLLMGGKVYAEKSVGTLMEEATYQEETVGDVNKAITIYQQVIADDEARRPEAAKATYRAGMCYLKKGDKDKAAKLFNDVITKFADQKIFAAKAQKELDKLGRGGTSKEISQDNGKTAGMQSINDAAEIVMLEAPAGARVLTAVSIFGSRYGTPEAPAEDFTVTVSDDKFKTIKKFTFPYSSFNRGEAKWVKLPIAGGLSVPEKFCVWVDFRAARTKGVYVHYDNNTSGQNSFIGIYNGEKKRWDKGQWMIRATLNGQAVDNIISKYKEQLNRNITINVSTSPDGDKLTIQYAATEVCKAADIPYQWDKSQKSAGEKTKQYIEPIHFENTSADKALTSVLEPVGLTYEIDENGLYLCNKPASPPKVVKTVPEAFTNDVDPSLTEITVTFDQKMMDENWSWTGGGDTLPKSNGKIHYDPNMTTCINPVKLEPGKVYWVGVNSPSFRSFTNSEGLPAPWYIILFATKGSDGTSTPIPNDMLEKAKAINGQPNEKSSLATSFKDSTVKLLDPNTRADYNRFEAMFADFFTTDKNYQNATIDQKNAMIETWMVEAASDNFDTRTKAIAQLGNVQAQKSLDILMQVVQEPMKNYRPKWMAIRALGRIGDIQAVPTLIDFVDNGNPNTSVYAKASLAEITGVYFGADKEKWRQWYKDRAKNTTPAQKTAAEVLSQKGWKLWGQRQLPEAEQTFKQAVAKDPTNTNAWNGLGWSQLNQGKSLAAEQSFTKCIELEPKHAAALNGLGWIAQGKGNVDEAIKWWEKAVEVSNGNATASLSGLTQVYMERGDYKKAVKYYQMWLKVEPNNAEAKAGLEKAKKGKK